MSLREEAMGSQTVTEIHAGPAQSQADPTSEVSGVWELTAQGQEGLWLGGPASWRPLEPGVIWDIGKIPVTPLPMSPHPSLKRLPTKTLPHSYSMSELCRISCLCLSGSLLGVHMRVTYRARKSTETEGPSPRPAELKLAGKFPW